MPPWEKPPSTTLPASTPYWAITSSKNTPRRSSGFIDAAALASRWRVCPRVSHHPKPHLELYGGVGHRVDVTGIAQHAAEGRPGLPCLRRTREAV